MDRARSNECTFAENQFGAGRLILVQMDSDEIIHHISLSCIDSAHVDRYRSGLNPEFLLVSHKPSGLGCVNDVFARQARYVRTGASYELPLDNGRSFSFPGQGPRQQFPSHPATEHQDVVLFDFPHVDRLLFSFMQIALACSSERLFQCFRLSIG